MLTREDRQLLCVCGHQRAEHSGKERLEDCCGCDSSWRFCSCKKFRVAKFNSQEEIEMAKSNSTKKLKSKGEKRVRGERIRMIYAFDAERAKKVRDEQYKDKENMIAAALNALIGGRKDGYTKPEMIALLKEEMGSKYTTGFPLKMMKKFKVIKSSKERSEPTASVKPNGAAKPEKKAKKARKPRIKKIDNVEVSEAVDSVPF